MTAVRACQLMVAVFLIAFGLELSDLSASELNDSIQAFHRGDYQTAYQGLNALIQKGERDARVHYYRGLIFFRQGNRQSAAADFQAAMQLEANGRAEGVSESLQRVQGHERLVVEKYRAMARLAAKQRTQPVAPPPIQPSSETIQLATAEAPIQQAPLFRLASEVPIRTAASDSLQNSTKSLLADDAPAEPNAVPSESTSTAGEPVGTGVANVDDPFGDVDSLDANDFGAEKPGAITGAKPSNVVGSVFRALFRANVPNVSGLANTSGVLPPEMAPGAEPPPFDAADDGDGSLFGDDSADDADDPFGDF